MRNLVYNNIEFGLDISGGLFPDIFEIWNLKFWGGIYKGELFLGIQ